MDYSERRMRAEIVGVPGRQSTASRTWSRTTASSRTQYTVAVDIHVQGDEIVADFSRTSPQARGPINATLGCHPGRHLQRHAASDRCRRFPKNSGCFRPIRVVAPPATVANVDYPGPLVAGNTETHPRLANIVIGAMSACVPQRAMASESCTGTNFVFGGMHPEYDEYFACYDLMSGGWGGRYGHDGNDCVIAINGNCRFNPTEVFETRFPLRVEMLRTGARFRRRRRSGAAGLVIAGLC